MNHDVLSVLRSDLDQPYAKEVQDLFFTYMRQLNLSFSPTLSKSVFNCNLKAQAQACLRFASSLEDTLNRTIDSVEEHSLLEKMERLHMK